MVTEETLKHYRNKITYAQNREDLLLESFFNDQKTGFYVDIGGFDPDYDSVTKLFYLKGWSGINVEPQPSQFQAFVKRRKRDININAAVGNTTGTMKLRVYNSGGLSTLSDKIKRQYVESDNPEVAEFEEINVKVLRLDAILEKHAVKHIDFMKVDVEGFEEEVLRSNNWKKYRPRVLCVESGIAAVQVQALLLGVGYVCVFNDGLNDYYIDERKHEFTGLSFIEHLLIRRGSGVRYEDYRNILSLSNHNKKLQQELEEERERHRKEEADLQKRKRVPSSDSRRRSGSFEEIIKNVFQEVD